MPRPPRPRWDERMTSSLWHRDQTSLDGTPFEPDARHDVVVVGAGITGLSTAVMLAEAGVDVALVDAGEVGQGATGASVGMASLLQGTTLAALRAHHPAGLVKAYVDANRAGQEWLAARAGAAADRRTAFTFGRGIATDSAIDAVRDAAREAGLSVAKTPPPTSAVAPPCEPSPSTISSPSTPRRFRARSPKQPSRPERRCTRASA